MGARLAVLGALVIGAALRFYPVWFALPYAKARPDETTSLGHAVAILAGDPNPHFFNWPSLPFYLFAGFFTMASWFKGTLSNVDLFLVARSAVALAGTATILVIARLGRQVANARTAALAAWFLAVAVLHVRDSHFATVDVLLTLLVTGSLVLVLDAMEAPTTRAIALAGFVGGLAASTKYSAAALVLPMLFLRPGSRPHLRDLVTFGAAFAAGFFLTTPYAALDYPQFTADLQYEAGHLRGGHGVDVGWGWSYHSRRSLLFGLGPVLFVAAIGGAVPFWRRYRRFALPIGAFALATFAALGAGRTVFFRYILPLVPILCLSAAIGVESLAGWIAARLSRPRGAVTAILAALVAGPSLVTSMQIDRLLAQPDSRVLASEWLRPQLRSDATLCDVEEAIGLDLRGVEFHNWHFDKPSATFVNAGDRLPDWLVLYESPVRQYAAIDPRMADLARREYTLAFEVRGVGRAMRSVFDPQDAFFLPIFGLSGIPRPGPDVFIYRRASARDGR